MFDKNKQAEHSQNKMQYIPLHWRCMLRVVEYHKLDWIIPFYLVEYLFIIA